MEGKQRHGCSGRRRPAKLSRREDNRDGAEDKWTWAVEGIGWDMSWQGFKGESRLRGSHVVCLHLEQGALGNGATSVAPHRECWGTGTIRDSKKTTGSCAFMWSRGRLLFNLPETRAGSGFSSGAKLRLQLCFAFPMPAAHPPSALACSRPSTAETT